MNEFNYKMINGRNFMLVSCDETGKNIETQIRMLTSGEMKTILPALATSKNGVPILQYDITGQARLSEILQGQKLSQQQFLILLRGMVAALEECESFTLSSNGLCLSDGSIYFDAKNQSVRFVYQPTLQLTSSVETCRELLRGFIAYGKVQHNALSSAVTDAINRSDFSHQTLASLLVCYATPVRTQSQPMPSGSQALESLVQEAQSAASSKPVAPVIAKNSAEQAPRFSAQPRTPPAAAQKPYAAPLCPEKKLSTPVSSTPVALNNSKNKFLILLSIAISLILVVAVAITPVVRLPDGKIDPVKIIGLLFIAGALDFLVLRQYIGKTKGENPSSKTGRTAKAPKEKPAKKKKGKKQTGKEPVKTAGTPFAPPIPQRESTPAVPPPAQAPIALPVFSGAPAPAPVAVPSPATDHASFVPASADPFPLLTGDETVVFEQKTIPGELYLQTDGGEVIVLSKTPFIIGRDRESSDHWIAEETVGRMHAQFCIQGDGWVVIDQNSRNHTYLNEQCLDPYTPYPILSGDVIRLAKIVLQVKSR